MVIIYNGAALIKTILSVVIFAFLYWILPESWVDPGTRPFVLFFGIASLISLTFETKGIKGRIFWIPMWILALLGLALSLSFYSEIWGPLGTAMFGVGYFAFINYYRKKRDARNWELAQQAIMELPKYRGESLKFWQLASAAIYLPQLKASSTEVCQHNLEVIPYLEPYMGQGTKADGWLSDFRKKMQAGTMPGVKKVKVGPEIEKNLRTLLNKKIEIWDKEENAGNPTG